LGPRFRGCQSSCWPSKAHYFRAKYYRQEEDHQESHLISPTLPAISSDPIAHPSSGYSLAILEHGPSYHLRIASSASFHMSADKTKDF